MYVLLVEVGASKPRLANRSKDQFTIILEFLEQIYIVPPPRKGLNMNIQYLAGLFDGEGTITLSKRTSTDKYRTPTLSMTSTTKALVDAMYEQFGGWVINKKTYKDHHKQAWTWYTNGNSAIAACEALSEHLLEPQKQARMRLIISEYKSVTPRNGKYTAESKTIKEQFEERFFEL